MDLAELKFVVDTKDLEDAAKKVADLGTEVSKLNKPMQELSRESAKTNKELSKAEEAAAKAALAQTKLEQAQSKSTQAAGKSISVLERQNLILEFMAQGNSKGQASILATAKAAGALDDEMLELNKTLVTQRTLIGGDPFDKSIGLMQKLQNEYKITTEVTDLFNRNLGLTEKQMTDLAREKQRLIALYGIEGKSLSGLSAEYEQLIQKSVKLNQANDARTNSMKAQIKAQSDAAKANEYLVSEIERVNRLTQSNGELTSATNNKLIQFEKALKASGTSAADQVSALEKYKASLLSIQKASGNRQIDYLSRALGPQITDIAVGLATGQAPLTILLQQGGQLRDQFALAGVAGSEMGKMLIQASKSMVSSIKDVGLAIGQVFVGAITGSGKAITNFGMQITGTSLLLDLFRAKLVSIEGENGKLVASFDRLGKAFPAVIGTGIFLAISTLIALIVEYSKVIAAEKELTQSLAMSGAALAMSSTTAIEYAKSMNGVGISTRDAMQVIAEFANTGSDASIPLEQIIKSAIDMQKYVGIATKDTTKAFSDIAEKPVEGLIKLAKSTGNVSAATILQAEAFMKAGKTAEAAQLAQEALRDSNEEVVRRMKNDLDPLQTLWLDIKTGVNSASQAIYDLLKSSTAVAIFRTVWETVAVIATEVWYVIKQTGKEISGVFSQIKAVMSGDFKGAADIGKQMKADAAIAREEQDKLIASIMNRNNAEKETLRITEEQRKANRNSAKEIEDRIKKEKKKPEQERAIVVPLSRDIAIVQKDFNEQLRLAEGFAKDERAILKARFDAGLIDRAEFISRDTELLSRSEQKQLEVVESFRAKYKEAKDAQEKLLNDALSRTKDVENRRVLQTAIDNLDKDFKEFNSTLDDTKTKINSAFGSREQVVLLEFQKAAFESTKTFREYSKSQEDATNNRRIDAELRDRLLTTYGAEAVKIRAVADETKRQTAEISKFTIAQQRAFEAYQNTLNDPSASGTVRAEAYRAYITAMENANNAISISRVSIENAGTDAVVAYYKQEYSRISNGITDSIVTALFEGGKAGSRKIRNLIIAELQKPITIMVKALVDVGMNALVGNGAAGSFSGSIVGSFLQKAGGMTVGGTTLGAAAGAFGQGVISGFGMGAPVASIGAPTSAAFNAGATYGAPVAGAAAGVMANKLISQGYEINKTVTALENVATIAAAFIPGLGPLVALGIGAISGLTNRAFGMKAKQITGEGIVGTLTTQGADVKAFEDWFQKGGWFRSNRGGRNYSAISTSLQEYLNLSLTGLTASTKSYAAVLGLEAKDIDTVTKSIELNLKGLSQEDRKKKIDEALGGFGDELAKKLGFESFDALQKLGEQVLQERYNLETQLLELQGDTVALRAREREQIYETNRGLYDQINAIKDKQKADEEAARAMEKLTNITTSIVDEINRLRGVNTSNTDLEAQFAILTAQARSGNLEALSKLPEITKGLEQIAASTAINATDIIFARARLAQSLQDTLGYTGGFNATATASMSTAGSVSTSGAVVTSSVNSSSSNQELLAALVTEIQGLRAEVRADVSHNAKTAKILERVNQDGESLTITTLV